MQIGVFDLTEKTTKKRVKKSKKSIWIMLLFAAVIWLFVSLSNYFSSVILSVCNAQVKSLTMSAVNNATIDILSQSITYDKLILMEKDANGDISLFEINSVLVNQLARDTAKKTEEYLKKAAEQKIEIPLGLLTNIDFLSDFGPKIEIKSLQLEEVNCTFSSEFEEAGINQTRHKIFLNIIANIHVILPTSSDTITTNAQVLICESLIVGKVPQVYMSMGNIGGNLDLSP